MAKATLTTLTSGSIYFNPVTDYLIMDKVHKLSQLNCEHTNSYIKRVFISTKNHSQLYKGTCFTGFRDFIILHKPICDKCFSRWALLCSLAGNKLE
jgi:hypothetical protein